MNLTEQLCDTATALRWADLAEPVRSSVVDTTGNALSLMVGAARHPVVDRAVTALAVLDGPRRIPVLGRTEELPAVWAAVVHGMAGHVEDFDDTHPATVVHPGVPVVAAALSAAGPDTSGEELRTAIAVGLEASLRTASALVPAALDRGWHMTGLATGVGAALTAGRLLGLSPEQMRSAVGLASTQAAGVIESLGTTAKPWQVGKAAGLGYEAAVLAAAGLDGPAAPLEGRRGLLAIFTGSTEQASVLVEGLGERWELLDNEIKPYACGVVSHALVDLAVDAARDDRRPPREVRLTVHPFVLAAMGRTHPTDGLAAKFSASHCFAVGYLRGDAGLGEFSNETVADGEVDALRRRVTLVGDETVPRHGVRAELVDDDGAIRRLSRERPDRLDTEAIRSKARRVVGATPAQDVDGFLHAAFDVAGSPATLLATA